MSYQKHIIKRQLLEFQLSATADSFALQQEMADIYTTEIVPLIDAYLSAFSKPGTIDAIDVLELDLGKLDRSNLRSSFIEQVGIQLQQQLGIPADAHGYPLSRSDEPTLSIQQPDEPLPEITKTLTEEPFYGEKPVEEPPAIGKMPAPDLRQPVTIVFGDDDEKEETTEEISLQEEALPLDQATFKRPGIDLLQPVTIVFGEDEDASETAAEPAERHNTGSLDEPERSSTGEEAKEKKSAQPASAERLKTVRRSREEADSELLAHYFQTGTFPWWAESTDRIVLEQTLRRMLEKHVPIVQQLLADLLTDSTICQRFIYTFSDEMLLRILKACAPEPSPAIKRLCSEWKTFFQQEDTPLRLVFWMDVLQQTLTPVPQRSRAWTVPRRLLDAIRVRMVETITRLQLPGSETALPASKAVVAEPKNPLPAVEPLLSAHEAVIRLLAKMAAVFEVPELEQSIRTGRQMLRKHRKQSNGESISPEEWQQALEQLSEVLASVIGRAGASERPVQARKQTISAFSDSNNIPVMNAGLVILWPFLTTFFNRLGLLDEQQWTDRAAAEKACCALQYLVTGLNRQPLEAQLPLNKILCGLPLHEPLDTQLKLTKEELAHAEELLHAVIRLVPEWKNLTPNGLRGSYLAREALLSTRDGSWLLQVKRVPYDVLTDRIPWNFNHVKLPWMNTLLAVVW